MASDSNGFLANAKQGQGRINGVLTIDVGNTRVKWRVSVREGADPEPGFPIQGFSTPGTVQHSDQIPIFVLNASLKLSIFFVRMP